jgi:hypothetical protein
MNYYICGYSKNNIVISKPLKKENKKINFDNIVYNNKIFSKSFFDLSIKIKSEMYTIFIVAIDNKEKLYNILVDIRNNFYINNQKENNNKNNNITNNNYLLKLNVLISFKILPEKLEYMYDRIYYLKERQYPYKKLLKKYLINYIPLELIYIIIDFLKTDVIISFKIDKARNNNNFYLCLPKILY